MIGFIDIGARGVMLDTENLYLEGKDIRSCTGTVVDSTLINVPSSSRNASKERDPEMHNVTKHPIKRVGCSAVARGFSLRIRASLSDL
jgi:hypothetical protein